MGVKMSRAFLLLAILGTTLIVMHSFGAQPATSIEYAGFTHTAFGDALLELNENQLEVTNIGEGGVDGFRVELESVSNFELEWLEISGVTTSNNASIQIGTRSTLMGTEEREVFTFMLLQGFFAEGRNLRGVEIAPDFSSTGTEQYRFEIYNNGILVESITNGIGALGAVKPGTPNPPWPTTARILGDGDGQLGYTLSWGSFTEPVTFVFFFRDNLTLDGDELRIYAADDVGTFSSTSEWNMWLGDIPNLTILREEVLE